MKINFTGLRNFAMRAVARKSASIGTTVQAAVQQPAARAAQAAAEPISVNSVKAAAETIAAKPAEEAKELFCHQYWKDMKAEGFLRPSRHSCVDLHGQLNGINHHFINSPCPKHMDMVQMGAEGLTPRKMIYETDVAFKCLKPTEKPLCVFRSIGKKPDFFSEYKLYLKRCAIKKGEIIDMKEYAYATSDRAYANSYLTNNEGILYEINIPKGARVSRTGNDVTDEVVFPRSSKFICTDVKRIKDANNDYVHVKLDYIVPQEVV